MQASKTRFNSYVLVDELELGADKVVTVKDGGDIVPGVYDLEILEGNGNVMDTRVDFYNHRINWLAQSKKADAEAASKFRVILLEGDKLEFVAIDKVKLTAVKDFTPSNELGMGNYIVGKDIPSEKYKLSSNVELNPDTARLIFNSQ